MLTFHPGSSFRFSVYNTSSVYLELHNRKTAKLSSHNKHDGTTSLLLTPKQLKFSPAGPVRLLITVNGTHEVAHHQEAYGILPLVIGINVSCLHTIEVTLLQSASPATLQLKGLWLRKGGQLLHTSPRPDVVAQLANATDEKETDSQIGRRSVRLRRRLIEVMAPFSLLGVSQGPEWEVTSQHDRRIVPWLKLVQQNFINTTTSELVLETGACLTKRCQTQDSTSPAPATAQSIFFRAGAPNTYLFDRLWPFSSAADLPTALILVLGVADVETFLNTTSPTKHQVSQFVDEFSRSYSEFIQTIRRTAYSPASMSRRQLTDEISFQKGPDESYLYISATSQMPIFLVLPPLPPTEVEPRSKHLAHLLNHGMSKVLNELKWHIGDKRTFVIDTAGWLDVKDFVAQGVSTRTGSDQMPHVDLSLTGTGHVKFAQHLSPHLCHYLVDRDRDDGMAECPFDRHDEYTGNLYEPDESSVRKIIQEIKVKKVKEMFGVP